METSLYFFAFMVNFLKIGTSSNSVPGTTGGKVSVYWNERVRGLSPYVPGEQPRDRKFIKLNTNENPYPPSPKVAEAIRAVLADGAGGLRLYTDPACTELREAAARRYGLKPEQVFAGNGSDEVLAFAFGAFFEGAAGAEPVLFPDITYSFYPVYAKLWGVPFRALPLAEDFSVTPGDYAGPSGGAILPNPNAPTGRALAAESILDMVGALEKNKKLLILDEAYIDFAGSGGTGSVIPFIAEHPNLLVIRTLSKAASLAGLRAGFAAGGADLIEGLCRIRDSFNSYTLDRLALAGAAAALSDAAYYDGINRQVIAARDRTAAALAALGFTVIPSQANFIFAAPPAASGIGGPQFFAALREKGILVRHFNKPRIENYLRISIGTGEDMESFLGACEEILREAVSKSPLLKPQPWIQETNF
jgi:histidinol-phosphate aminotransferase